VIYDQDRFITLVKQLESFNNTLYQFCPLNKCSSLTLAVEAETLVQVIMKGDLAGVQTLQAVTRDTSDGIADDILQ